MQKVDYWGGDSLWVGIVFWSAVSFFILCLLVPNTARAAGPWKGDAYVARANAALGNRYFALRTVNDTASPSNRSSWELNAGDSITLFFKTWTDGTPPDAPTEVILRVYSDNGTTTLVRTLNSGSVPADGTSYTFFATDNGLNTGTAKAGMYRLYVQAICTGGLNCPLGTYDINSDSNGDKGALRSGIVVSDITKNAYPNSSTKYAYGTASDEQMTFTAATTDRLEDTGTNQTIRLNTRRNGGSVIQNGTSEELGSSGSTVESFVADNTYDATLGQSYDVEFEVVGTSNLLTGEKWTHIAASGNGGNITRDSATVASYNNLFLADARVYFSTNGTSSNDNVNTSQTVYNRGESVSFNYYLLNSRSEKLSRAMNVSVLAADDTVEEGPTSLTPSSNLYSSSYTIAAGDAAVADDTGDLHKFRVTNTDQTKDSNNAHGVSSKYYVDAHPELDGTLNKDDFPTEDANETLTGVIAADVFSFFGHVKNVRKDTEIDTSGSAVTFTIKKPDDSTHTTQTSDTGSDGWTSNLDFPTEAPSGSWTFTTAVSFNGNTGTDSETLTFVSPYAGNYALSTVGWNQTYDIGDTTTFTLQTMEKSSGTLTATAADSAPTYRLRYWDGATWQELVSATAMTSLAATATYEATYDIPNESAWIGRKIVVIFSATMSGTGLNEVREIEVVGSPAQVVINSMSDTTVPTLTAAVTITNEGSAGFEYTYEYCVVTAIANECGGGDDVAYGSAAKFIQAGQNFTPSLTLNVTDTGSYYFKVAVWWSNQSSKASRSFTATAASSSSSSSSSSDGGGGGGGGGSDTTTVVTTPKVPLSLAAIRQHTIQLLVRESRSEQKIKDIEARVAALEGRMARTAFPSTGSITTRPVAVSAPEVRSNIFHIRLR